MKTNPQLWWELARATGVTAWALSGLSVLGGLLLSTRAVRGRPTAAWQTDLHRAWGGLTVAFVVAHCAALVADGFVHFGPVELFVPFASTWKPGAVAWGIVAVYLLLAVEVTSLLRARVGRRVWHAVHLTSLLVYAGATVHAATAGTDRANPFFGWAMVLLTAVNVTRLAARVLLRRAPAPTRRARPGTVAAGLAERTGECCTQSGRSWPSSTSTRRAASRSGASC